MSSYNHFPESLDYAARWYRNECDIWRQTIEHAIKTGEIRRVDANIFAELFEDAYLGAAYAGLPGDSGYNVERVRHKLLTFYQTITSD